MSQPPLYQPNYESRLQGPPPTSGLATASMVLGIVSLVFFCAWYLAFPCAVVAIVLGAVAKSKTNRGLATGSGMATAGIVCGIISIGLVILIIVGLLSFLGFAASHAPAHATWPPPAPIQIPAPVPSH